MTQDSESENPINFKPKLFDIVKLRGSYRHRACRWAVFNRLFAKHQLEDEIEKYTTLRGLWHRKVYAMRTTGWAKLQDFRNFSTWLNCPPFGVITRDRARRCNFPSVCPYCYARDRILAPFVKMETVLYGCAGPFRVGGPGTAQLPVLRPELKIVAFRHNKPDGTKRFGAVTDKSFEAHWNALKMTLQSAKQRKYEYELFGSSYGAVQVQYFPKPDRLTYTRCGVLLTDSADVYRIAERYETAISHCEVADPSKKNLAAAFAWACSYPPELLFDTTNVAALCRLITAKQRTRSYWWYGGVPKNVYEGPS
jgi:hypothetical protein